ncbi:MAG: dipeptidase [Verrucomicrobiales bacterium]|nr:dipeptidase [Verrucomicrobiales bacterium]
MMTPQQYLIEHQARHIGQLCDYLRLPSVSAQASHREDVGRCAAWIEAHCREIGLNTELHPTRGHPIVLARTPRRPGRRPHFLVYGHYDVQPPEPIELWASPPFEPRVEGHSLFARGASDNKGQHFAHLKAVEAVLATGGELPCDLTFLIEGEEEVGSANLVPFLKQHRKSLRCDAVVISDTGMPARTLPALTYALRGIAALEVIVRGPSRDLHSGIFGGSLDNPAMALARMLAALRDRRGRITVPGFYDQVRPLTRNERRQLARLPFNERSYARFLGVPKLFGEAGFTAWEQRSARPTLEVNGLTSGYQGEGSKTIVPAAASAKLTMRLVPDQSPDVIARLVARHLKSICPPTVRLETRAGHGGLPYLLEPDTSLARAAMRTLELAFGYAPVLLREGGSIPIVTDFKRVLGADTLLLGLALPDDNAHSPNEKFDLRNFAAGARLGTLLWPELAGALAA